MIWQWIVVSAVLIIVAIRIVMGIRRNLKKGKGPVDCAGCPLSDKCVKVKTDKKGSRTIRGGGRCDCL